MFWERQKRSGERSDLKLARDLPDDTPDFILSMLADFEKEVAEVLFSGRRDGYWMQAAATETYSSGLCVAITANGVRPDSSAWTFPATCSAAPQFERKTIPEAASCRAA